MKIFLWIISAMWVVVGTAAIIAPAGLKKFYGRLVKPSKWLSVLALISGLLFLWAAPASSLGWFIRLLGVLALIKGAFLLLCPVSMLKATLNWWMGLPFKVYRVYGIFILLLAWVVISSIL